MQRSIRTVGPVAGLALIALLATACGSSATPSPSAAASSAPSAAATAAPATAAPTQAPTATPEPSAAATPTAAATTAASTEPSLDLGSFGALLHGAPDLEAALPDQVAGQQLQKVSFTASSAALGGANQSQEFQQIQDALGGLGKSLSDLTFAIASSDSLTIGAYRIAGVDANTVWNAFTTAMQQGTKADVSDANLGGKSVKKVVTEDSTTYLYPHGDTLFFVTSDSNDLLNAAMASLP
ncbi:MAG TPA: hypothetical protein VIV06_12640 [Candidatus Limnocylindrales bacterium]